MLMVQEALAASEIPQVLVCVNPALGVTDNASAPAPELVTVNDLAPLAAPTATLLNVAAAGLRATGATPVPVMEAAMGLPIPL